MLNEVDLENYLFKYSKRHGEFVQGVGEIIATKIKHISGIKSANTPFTLLETFKKEQDLNKIRNLQVQMVTTQVAELGRDLSQVSYIVFADSRGNIGEDVYIMPKDVKIEIEKEKLALLALINKPVFLMNNRKYTPTDIYNVLVNEVYMTHDMSGIKSVRNALNRFVNARSMFEYKDTDNNENRLTSAINSLRMSVLSSIKNIIEKTTNFIAKQFKYDGVELSAHIHPAPDHAPVQGKQFSNEEFEKMQSGASCTDVKGNVYEGFQRPIMAWNCRHYVKPIKIGKNKPEHSDYELNKILEENEKGYTTSDGKHYTLYECTQIQRGYERKIREYKERSILAKICKDKTKENEYKGKVQDYTRQYKTFSNACGLPVMSERIRIDGY